MTRGARPTNPMLTAAPMARVARARRKRVPKPEMGEFVSDFMIVLDYQTARKLKGNSLFGLPNGKLY